VTCDSDLEKARKLIKQIGLELQQDPEFGPNIIEPLKMLKGRRVRRLRGDDPSKGDDSAGTDQQWGRFLERKRSSHVRNLLQFT